MAWDTAADLLRDLVAAEHRHAPYGGHWPWDERLGIQPTEVTTGGTPVARIAGARLSVRRVLWVAVWGELPDDVRLLRTCVEPVCVRPVHGHTALTVGRSDPHRADDPNAVPASMIRWDAAAPPAGERRGRTTTSGARLHHGERRHTARAGMVTADLAGLGEHPGHLR